MNLLHKAAIRTAVGVLALLLLIGAVYLLWTFSSERAPESESAPTNSQSVATNTMLITSPSFENNGTIPKKFTCDGGNINPELQIQNIPSAAKSLALILHDPDAPVAGGFTHWVVWNIDPKVTMIKQESIPLGGIEGRNDGGKIGYIGPCPPAGAPHHYEFRFYALDTTLDLATTSRKADLEAAMQGHVIEETTFVGLYQR